MAAVRRSGGVDVPVEAVEVSVFCVPTDRPESDGTLEWSSTTLVLVEISAGAEVGLGWTYGSAAAGLVVDELLAPLLDGRDALDVGGATRELRVALRNVGYAGGRGGGGIGGRRGALGSQGEAPRPAARIPARARARDRPDLRQRRLLLVQRRAARRPARRLGRRRHPAREDEGRPRAAPRHRACSRRARGGRRRHGALRRRQRRVYARGLRFGSPRTGRDSVSRGSRSRSSSDDIDGAALRARACSRRESTSPPANTPRPHAISAA